ncbi:hypothetical protein [Rossellomorea marisflavi]|uniref:hypothetical protein n=1 Tax=Rossellomorea marisflavi TaxID=189381 RepID=UPI00069FAF54|nr:hypothetical protein [Rossellomorea marisflavi]TYO72806.1 hypothetical protein DQ398_001698 [Rossellomorea marisflavi]USK90482.1 hypothetical protein LIT29_12930 [Rossellomorea marisflavi]
MILRVLLVILSWFSLIFLRRTDILRYSPAAILVSFILTVVSFINPVLKLWKVKGNKKAQVLADLSFIIGPFFAATIWVFKLSFHSFPLYLFLNGAVNYFFAYPMTAFFQKQGLYKLLQMNKHVLYGVSILYAIVIYLYQRGIENLCTALKDIRHKRFSDVTNDVLAEKISKG